MFAGSMRPATLMKHSLNSSSFTGGFHGQVSARQFKKSLKQQDVKFLRLQFSDIMGHNKNVEVPASQFEKALDGEMMFDGSSVEGFTRIEESDMLLKPDFATFLVFPDLIEDARRGRVARLICDITYPDGNPFGGDPRYILKRQVERLHKLGFDDMYAGPEPEFFLFERDVAGRCHDRHPRRRRVLRPGAC